MLGLVHIGSEFEQTRRRCPHSSFPRPTSSTKRRRGQLPVQYRGSLQLRVASTRPGRLRRRLKHCPGPVAFRRVTIGHKLSRSLSLRVARLRSCCKTWGSPYLATDDKEFN